MCGPYALVNLDVVLIYADKRFDSHARWPSA